MSQWVDNVLVLGDWLQTVTEHDLTGPLERNIKYDDGYELLYYQCANELFKNAHYPIKRVSIYEFTRSQNPELKRRWETNFYRVGGFAGHSYDWVGSGTTPVEAMHDLGRKLVEHYSVHGGTPETRGLPRTRYGHFGVDGGLSGLPGELGDCFKTAYDTALKIDGDVVHGTVTSAGKTFPHAWAEKGRTVYDDTIDWHGPKAEYYKQWNVRNPVRYYWAKAAAKAMRNRHWGPWE